MNPKKPVNMIIFSKSFILKRKTFERRLERNSIKKFQIETRIENEIIRVKAQETQIERNSNSRYHHNNYAELRFIGLRGPYVW